jgi:uncharacterized membrane protein SpoIIM required for sporulation
VNQTRFVERGQRRWRSFEQLLDRLERGKEASVARFPLLYRGICRDLAVAQQRQFDAHLIDRLNHLALRGHQVLYRPARAIWSQVERFFGAGFPRAVRAERGPVLVASLLFYLSAAVVAGLVLWRPELVYAVLDPSQVAGIEGMYDPTSTHHLRPRGVDSDAAMFGFYIRNNITAAFRTFASGIFCGLGSLFFIVFNGVFLGAVAGHLTEVGFGVTLYPFIIGHGALELTAIILAGAAGFRLGWALLSPGRLRRADALRVSARRALPLIYGSTAMLLGAAAIEAFWSAQVLIPSEVKYTAGASLWGLVTLYFLFAGRGHED